MQKMLMIFKEVVEVDSNNVTTVTQRNLNGSLDLGFEFMLSKQVNKAFNFMLSTNVFIQKWMLLILLQILMSLHLV